MREGHDGPGNVCATYYGGRIGWADARLIAAAPDMLEALKAAEGHLAETLTDKRWHPIGDCPVLNAVRVAIAKAEGTD